MNQSRSTFGFSLVELMVVISIISLIASLSIPSFSRLKIKASRAEAFQNLRLMGTMSHAYHAEYDEYYTNVGFIYGYSKLGASEIINCGSNDIGFSLGDCTGARYYYNFIGDTDSFTATARSAYFQTTAGVVTAWGNKNGPPARCKLYAGYSVFYLDNWEYDHNGVLDTTWVNTILTGDAMQDCL